MSLRNSTLLSLTVLFVSVLPTLTIMNKNTASIETPWMVFISKDSNNHENSRTSGKKTCSGALIHPQVVLTTATCLYVNLEETKNLIVEAYNQSRQVSQVNLRKFNLQYFLHNNYAVLKLSESFLLSSNLKTIILASNDEILDTSKCQQLTYYGKSSDNKTISKVMKNVLLSNYSKCDQDMFQLHMSYQQPGIFWHPSILCSRHIHLLECIELKDWSSMVTCPRYEQPIIHNPVFVGFQLTFLVFESKYTEKSSTVGKDECIMVYSNMFQASPWIKNKLMSSLKIEF